MRRDKPPVFKLGEHCSEGCDGDIALRKHWEAGLELVKVAPQEFWVMVAERRDEWADYSEFRGKIVWSYNRINHILKAEGIINDSIRSIYGIQAHMSSKLAREIIERHCADNGIDLNGFYSQYQGREAYADVSVQWEQVDSKSRYSIAD